MKLSFFFSLTAVALFLERSEAAACFEGATHFHPDDWAHCQPLSDDLFMYYTPFEEEGNVMIGLHASSDTFGWTALAFGGNGGMKGASQIVVRRDEDRKWVAEDRYSDDYVMPTLDEQQDVKLLFANQTDAGETSWGVLVPMSSCDDPFDYPVQDSKVYMHWAFGNDHAFYYHGTRRGQFHANLMQAPEDLPSTDGLEYLDFLMPNVPVVLGENGTDPSNPYICSYFDLEELSGGRYDIDQVIHMTRFSPVLAEESGQYVHHMILFGCDGEDESDSDEDAPAGERAHLQIVPECEAMPSGCSEMKYPWAVGGGDTALPPNVGMPINEGPKYMVLQVHYYNMNLDEGVTDNSGIRAYFTTDLREQEAGTIQFNGGTGSWQRPALPSGVEGYQLPPFTIPSECTEKIWNEPLNLIGVVHHMHLYGTNMELLVERDGKNMGVLRNEQHYDFNHQSIEQPNPALRSLLPGDKITMNCRYDTSRTTNDITFGDLTQQEMCYGAAIYYPRQEMDSLLYVQLPDDFMQCITPATHEEFVSANVSLCAQNLFENVPKYFQFEHLVPEPFGLLDTCNGGEDFDEVLEAFPGVCPSCQLTGTCTAEEVGMHAQGYCVYDCSHIFNVTTYPDMSQTDPNDSGYAGCGTGATYFKTPEMAELEVCQIVGNLDQVIELQDAIADDNSMDGTSVDDTTVSNTSVNDGLVDGSSVDDASNGDRLAFGTSLVTCMLLVVACLIHV